MEGDRYFRIAGKCFPKEACAKILSHEDRYTEINSKYVFVVPVVVRVEGIAEAITVPAILTVVVLKRALDAKAVGGKEGKGACGGVGNDGAVDAAKAAIDSLECGVRSSVGGAGTAPGYVAVLGVRSADAPVVL